MIYLLRYYNIKGELIEISINKIEDWISHQKNKNELADFIYNRFYYRYIKPFEYVSDKKIKIKNTNKLINEYSLLYKNGFSIMANCCLLIEAIETFQRGWKNSNFKSEIAFLKFFSRDKNFTDFSTNDMSTLFYKKIRCGILHQGEITDGWKITRSEDKPILNIKKKELNATKFLETLKKSIEDYKTELKKAEWEDEIWRNAKIKIKSLIKQSKRNEN